MKDVVIVDYALGNLFNVQRALESLGCNPIITNEKEEIEKASKIILPGVGAFGEGMKHLKKDNLDKIIIDAAKQKKPVLGICLGMQILMSESQEHGRYEGLNLIPGKVIYLDFPEGEDRFKIPQIGWNMIEPSDAQKLRGDNCFDATILEGVGKNAFMYFVHSLYVKVDKQEHSLAETFYGNNKFCSIAQNQNVIGCQFHPERSAEEGIKILDNFLSMKEDN